MVTEQKTLERLTVENDGRVFTYKGRLVNAEPVSQIDLLFVDIRDDVEKTINEEAPLNADSYMLSRHSYGTRVGYPGLLSEERLEGAPQFSIYGLQYWRKK